MKRILTGSLVMNASLSGAFLLLLLSGRKAQVEDATPFTFSMTSPGAPTALESSGSREEQEAPFHWSQLESTNYGTYIANLRSIDCPEQTIADIITADVRALYAGKRRELQERYRTIGAENPEAEWGLQRLRNEEASLLSTLIAGLISRDKGGKSETEAPSGAVWQQTNAPASVPLVWQQVDLTTFSFNASQFQAIADLRERFIGEIGGKNQAPDDPAYLARWLKAQPEIDRLLQGVIGLRAYQNYELLARGVRWEPQSNP